MHKYIFPLLCVLMFGLSYAFVPLYRIFCQKTGFGGTPQKGEMAHIKKTDRYVRVQFTATVNRDLPWSFRPMQHEMVVRVGEQTLTYYKTKNLTNRPIKGMATYNVSPDLCGSYFYKIHCFCFEQQTLQPYEEVTMPVLFCIDPDIEKEKDLEGLTTLTLSYTFFING